MANEIDLSKYGAVPVEESSDSLDLSKYGAVPVDKGQGAPLTPEPKVIDKEDVFRRGVGAVLPGMETALREMSGNTKKERRENLENTGMMAGSMMGATLGGWPGEIAGGAAGSAAGTIAEKGLERAGKTQIPLNKQSLMMGAEEFAKGGFPGLVSNIPASVAQGFNKKDVQDVGISAAKGAAYSAGGLVVGAGVKKFASVMKEVFPSAFKTLGKISPIGTKMAIKFRDVLEEKAWGTAENVEKAVDKAHEIFSNAVGKFKASNKAAASTAKNYIENQSGLLMGKAEEKAITPVDAIVGKAKEFLDETADRYTSGSKAIVSQSKKNIEASFSELSSAEQKRVKQTKADLELAKKKLGIFRDFNDPKIKQDYLRLMGIKRGGETTARKGGNYFSDEQIHSTAEAIMDQLAANRIQQKEAVERLRGIQQLAGSEESAKHIDDLVELIGGGDESKLPMPVKQGREDKQFQNIVRIYGLPSGGVPKTKTAKNFARIHFIEDYVSRNADKLGTNESAKALMVAKDAAQQVADYSKVGNAEKDNAYAMKVRKDMQEKIMNLPGFREVLANPMEASALSAKAKEELEDVMGKPQDMYKFLKSVFEEVPGGQTNQKMIQLVALEKETGQPLLEGMYKDYRKREAILKSEFPMQKEYQNVIDYVKNNMGKMSPDVAEKTLLSIQSSLSKVESYAKGDKMLVADDAARMQQELIGEMFKGMKGYEVLKDPLASAQAALKTRNMLAPYIQSPEKMNDFLKIVFSGVESPQVQEVKAGLMALGNEMGQPSLLADMHKAFQDREIAMKAVFPFDNELRDEAGELSRGRMQSFLSGLYHTVDLDSGEGQIAREQIKKLDSIPGMRKARIEAWKQFAARDFKPWFGSNLSQWDLRILKSLPATPFVSMINPRAGAIAKSVDVGYLPVVATRMPKLLGATIKAGKAVARTAASPVGRAAFSGATRGASDLLMGGQE